MFRLRGKLHPAASAVPAEDAALKKEAEALSQRGAHGLLERLSVVWMHYLRLELGLADGAIFWTAPEHLVTAVVVPRGSIFVWVPVPDAKFRRFGGES